MLLWRVVAAAVLGLINSRQGDAFIHGPTSRSFSCHPRRLYATNLGDLELWLDLRGTDTLPSDVHHFNKLIFDGNRHVFQEGHVLHSTQPMLIINEDKMTEKDGRVVGAAITIDSPAAQQKAISMVGSVEWLFVSCTDWALIPAENLVSFAQGTGTRVAVAVTSSSQVQGAAFALHSGVDALVMGVDPHIWVAAFEARAERNRLASESPAKELSLLSENYLHEAVIQDIKPGGVGDRVCVDLVQNLEEGEGLLVGSSAKLLALVLGETLQTGFVPARPFRVNAGPVHSYVAMADGSTKYLAELVAGDSVLVVKTPEIGTSSTPLETRPVTVGRLKRERRPVLMVTFSIVDKEKKLLGSTGQIFLQQAETVRLTSSLTGKGLPVTSIQKGDSIFVRLTEKGTHVGRQIDATVEET